MPIIEVEGQRFEFPDGTTDEVIGQSIRGFFGIQQDLPENKQEQPSINGSGVDNGNIGSGIDLPSSKPTASGYEKLAQSKFGIAEDKVPASPMQAIEPAIAIASGAIAEPLAGIAGIAQAANPFSEKGAGARAVESVRDFMTIDPKTTEGKEGMAAVSGALAPVTEALDAVDDFAGESVLDATGSPFLASLAKTVPTLAVELLTLGVGKGVRTTKGVIKKQEVKSLIAKSAPEIDQLKDAARGVYKELDEAGITLKPTAYNKMVNKVVNNATGSGFSRKSAGVLLPKSNAVIKALEDGIESGTTFTLQEIDNLRKQAGIAANAIENTADAAVGSAIVSSIDDFLDNAGSGVLNRGSVPSNQVGPKYKAARQLWGRARRAEVLDEAFYKASNQASGFENGIVTQFRSILNNKKKRNMFKGDELKAIKDVVDGTKPRTLAKLIGKFGFTEGNATGFLGGSIGAGAGYSMLGTTGMIAVPLVGQVSKQLAQRLTKNSANFANQVVRAGSDANAIAKAYIKNTPSSQRSSSELSELLMNTDIDLNISSSNPLIVDAIDTARGSRIISSVVAAQAARETVKEEK